MRILTKPEIQEFEKTFYFLNVWVGSMHINANSVSELRFDGFPPGAELIKFARGINNLFKVEELDLYFNANDSELRRINVLFNFTNAKKKEVAMNRLVKYCFNNRVQPSRLRFAFKTFSIVKNEDPEIYEYGAA